MTWILVGALVIGVTLGMLGSGGSAVTVPMLIYLVGHGAKESIAESMAIVGLISIVAAGRYAQSRQIDWPSVWFFGVPGMFGTFLGAWLGGLAADQVQLVVFGVVLLAASSSMLRRSKRQSDEAVRSGTSPRVWVIGVQGAVVGIVTGFVGVGGGFLIVPALVVLANLPIRLAIGTSLVIIAANCAVGFAKYEHYLLAQDASVDLRTIAVFSTIGVVGSLIGRAVNSRLNQQTLRQVFAGFLIVLGGFVIVREGSKLISDHVATSVARGSTEVQYPTRVNVSAERSARRTTLNTNELKQ